MPVSVRTTKKLLSYMPFPSSKKGTLKLTKEELDILWKTSLKGYRFLTLDQISLLFNHKKACREKVAELREEGLVERLFIPRTHEKEKEKEVFTLSKKGAKELSLAFNVEMKKLFGGKKFSPFFLKHEIKISDFMCSLEKALKDKKVKLVFWKGQKELRSLKIKVLNPEEKGERIPIIPDGLFSIEKDERRENFFLEADRGTESLFNLRKKMLGYIQFFRKGFHEEIFELPHFRTLIVTTNLKRIKGMVEALKDIGYCPNMFFFSLWEDISPQKILSPIWFRCHGEKVALI